jgi:hypothetical protein
MKTTILTILMMLMLPMLAFTQSMDDLQSLVNYGETFNEVTGILTAAEIPFYRGMDSTDNNLIVGVLLDANVGVKYRFGRTKRLHTMEGVFFILDFKEAQSKFEGVARRLSGSLRITMERLKKGKTETSQGSNGAISAYVRLEETYLQHDTVPNWLVTIGVTVNEYK